MMLAWLGELIDQTCMTPSVLVGTWLGGSIAARFAADHSDRLARLVRPGPGALVALVRHSARPSERTLIRLFRQVTLNPDRVQQQMGARWGPFLAYSLELSRTPSVQQANRRLLRELGLPQIPPEDLARIGVPTTLIWGRHDRVMPLPTAQQASARYGWPLQVIEDAGHLVVVERPDALLEALPAAPGNR